MAINPEIRDQAYLFFVEEVPELLQALESGLLTLSQDRSTAKVHNLMRAAHSLKGGAASIGLQAIATLAHRLETIFRACYSDTFEIDANLEDQLLQAFDCLRLPLIEQIETGRFDAEATLAIAEPIFSRIEDYCGEALNQSESYIPSSADLGIDMVTSILEVDVDQGIKRLQTVVANPHSYEVAGELRAQVEVFAGFGEILNLPCFEEIAAIAKQALDQHPDRALEITQLTLIDFEASRQAILAGDRTPANPVSPALMALANRAAIPDFEDTETPSFEAEAIVLDPVADDIPSVWEDFSSFIDPDLPQEVPDGEDWEDSEDSFDALLEKLEAELSVNNHFDGEVATFVDRDAFDHQLAPEVFDGEHFNSDAFDGEYFISEHFDSEYFDSEHSDSEIFDSEHSDREHFTSNHLDSEIFDSEIFDSEHFDSEHFDSEHFDSEYFTSDHLDSDHFDSEYSDSEHSDSEHFTSEHFTSESFAGFPDLNHETVGHKVVDSQILHSQTPGSDVFDSEISEELPEEHFDVDTFDLEDLPFDELGEAELDAIEALFAPSLPDLTDDQGLDLDDPELEDSAPFLLLLNDSLLNDSSLHDSNDSNDPPSLKAEVPSKPQITLQEQPAGQSAPEPTSDPGPTAPPSRGDRPSSKVPNKGGSLVLSPRPSHQLSVAPSSPPPLPTRPALVRSRPSSRRETAATPHLTTRVDSERLDRMNNLVGELSINRDSLSLQNEQLRGVLRELLNRFSRFQEMASRLRDMSDQAIVASDQYGQTIRSNPKQMPQLQQTVAPDPVLRNG
ncbi:MAG: Hpt domain-containing protein, partial [Synechococcales bacterium]|nr:Hpt domain-containing protein [Synechococcales bacterium]